MQYTTIPSTTLNVSRISFGTASLHHLPSRRDRLCLLNSAFDHGITHFDTSPYYGLGLAEADLSKLVPMRRTQMTVASKVGLYPSGWYAQSSGDVWMRKALGKIFSRLSRARVDWSVRSANRSVEMSLSRMRLDYLDVLFLHDPTSELINLDEFTRWGESLRSSGKVRYLGLAGDPSELVSLIPRTASFATIVQSKDSIDVRESDILLANGRPLQFTYGYLRSGGADDCREGVAQRMTEALTRNQNGSVVISTRRLARLSQLSKLLL